MKMTIRGLLEVVQTGAANIEIAIMGSDNVLKQLSVDEIQAKIDEIEKEKIEEVEKRRTGATN